MRRASYGGCAGRTPSISASGPDEAGQHLCRRRTHRPHRRGGRAWRSAAREIGGGTAEHHLHRGALRPHRIERHEGHALHLRLGSGDQRQNARQLLGGGGHQAGDGGPGEEGQAQGKVARAGHPWSWRQDAAAQEASEGMRETARLDKNRYRM
ncbi:hypothetical protein ACLF3G_04940 [Falsiroseomonas sp. HC035]|uniref:hypothetical protein n=1 Tax=Falsiroseomonas sp. HC035 TaxID=3390999 RepID=UPI003D311441